MTIECNDKLASAQCSVLAYLVKLNKAIDANHRDLVQALVNRFCDELIDYVSFAHYRFLRRRAVADHHSVAIDRITQEVVEFNDRYGTTMHIEIGRLKADLESLAFALETRFEIEDELAQEPLAATA